MIAVIVVGLARSGKDSFADYLCGKYGFEKFVFSDLIAEELQKRNMEVTKGNMAKLGDELRKAGMGILGEMMVGKIKGKTKVVLVGARSPEEIQVIKENLEKVKVVKISATKEKRFERRSNLDPPKERAFFNRDKRDIEKKGLDEVLELADFEIENYGNLNEFFAKVDEFMKTFKY